MAQGLKTGAKAKSYIRCRTLRFSRAGGFCAKAHLCIRRACPESVRKSEGKICRVAPAPQPGLWGWRDPSIFPTFFPPARRSGGILRESSLYAFAEPAPRRRGGVLSSHECRVRFPCQSWSEILPQLFPPSAPRRAGNSRGATPNVAFGLNRPYGFTSYSCTAVVLPILTAKAQAQPKRDRGTGDRPRPRVHGPAAAGHLAQGGQPPWLALTHTP